MYCKHAVMCQNQAGIDPMLLASGQYRPGSDTSRHVYMIFSTSCLANRKMCFIHIHTRKHTRCYTEKAKSPIEKMNRMVTSRCRITVTWYLWHHAILWHFCYGLVRMAVTWLGPVRRQGICNHHCDVGRSVHIPLWPRWRQHGRRNSQNYFLLENIGLFKHCLNAVQLTQLTPGSFVI